VRVMESNGMWQELYKAAMLELNPSELPRRIEIADAAIRRRNEELRVSYDPITSSERQQLADALNSLRVLRSIESKSSSLSPRPGLQACSESGLL
jgi:hypothetical protein